MRPDYNGDTRTEGESAKKESGKLIWEGYKRNHKGSIPSQVGGRQGMWRSLNILNLFQRVRLRCTVSLDEMTSLLFYLLLSVS